MKLIFSRKADSDLEDIQLFIQQDNPMAAIKFTEAAIKQIGDLKTFPDIGHPVKDLKNVRRLVVKNFPYFIFYKVELSVIRILRVYHMSRKYLF